MSINGLYVAVTKPSTEDRLIAGQLFPKLRLDRYIVQQQGKRAFRGKTNLIAVWRVKHTDSSKYTPHQGKRECARRAAR